MLNANVQQYFAETIVNVILSHLSTHFHHYGYTSYLMIMLSPFKNSCNFVSDVSESETEISKWLWIIYYGKCKLPQFTWHNEKWKCRLEIALESRKESSDKGERLDGVSDKPGVEAGVRVACCSMGDVLLTEPGCERSREPLHSPKSVV